MDRRQALAKGFQLCFPGLTCVVEEEIGRGSNAIVYHGWYTDGLQQEHKHHILIKELFPYHDKGAISRNQADGSLLVTEDGMKTWLVHRQSFLHGNQIHLRLRERYPSETGGNINSFAHQNTLYTILDFTGGRTMDRMPEGASRRLTLRRVTQRMMNVLESLMLFHEQDFLHLDISPDNILLLNEGKQERMELIDYNSVITLEQLRAGAPVHLSMKEGFTAPEIRSHSLRSVGFWTDIYSVTAVFYRFLTGTNLNRMQQSGLMPVAVNQCPLVAAAPMTVQRQLQKIIAKGLASVPGRRYQTAQEMLSDFQELLNRIDGVGITHWSLWEAARSNLMNEIKRNPSMSLVKDGQALYPVDVEGPENRQWSDLVRMPSRAMLIGQGGQGKTTLLMRTCWQESKAYYADKPVFFYIPLYEYRAGQNYFLQDYLLRRLHFSADTNSYDVARHMLNLLLQRPLKTKHGERPVVCLLLDGYNEISCDSSGLQAEIERLACMDGVSLVITSRTPLTELNFETWKINPLSRETVQQVLTKEKLLLPESESMYTLLRNAMMLSLYVRICRDGNAQPSVTGQEQLIYAYLDTLLDKEIRDLPDGSEEKAQLEAAVRCVYPIIAETSRTHPGNGMELLRRIKRVYQELGKSPLVRLFPQWIGQTASVRGASRDADEWYSLMVFDLLWRRLGLVYRDEQGGCYVIHQEFRDALAADGQRIVGALEKKRRRRRALTFGALCCLIIAVLGCAAFVVKNLTEPLPPAYEIRRTEKTLDMMQAVCIGLNNQIDAVESLLDYLDPEKFDLLPGTFDAVYSFDRLLETLENTNYLVLMDMNSSGGIADDVGRIIDEMMAEGERMPWNTMPFDPNTAIKLAERQETFGPEYAEYIRRLRVVYQYGTEEEYKQYAKNLRQLLYADAELIAAWQYIAFTSRLEGLDSWSNTSQGKASAGLSKRIHSSQAETGVLQSHTSPQWLSMTPDQLLNECSTTIMNARDDAEISFLSDMTYERLRRKHKLK